MFTYTSSSGQVFEMFLNPEHAHLLRKFSYRVNNSKRVSVQRDAKVCYLTVTICDLMAHVLIYVCTIARPLVCWRFYHFPQF